MAVPLDQIGNWDDGAVFSKDLVRNQYLKNSHSFSFSKAGYSNRREGIFNRADDLLRDLKDASTETEITVFFPPYSSLYWHELKLLGKYDVYVDIKRLACARMIQNSKIRVLDFQGIEQTKDLDHYMDSKHYDDLIYSLMTKELNQSAYRIKDEVDVGRVDGEVDALLEAFQHENQEWL